MFYCLNISLFAFSWYLTDWPKNSCNLSSNSLLEIRRHVKRFVGWVLASVCHTFSGMNLTFHLVLEKGGGMNPTFQEIIRPVSTLLWGWKVSLAKIFLCSMWSRFVLSMILCIYTKACEHINLLASCSCEVLIMQWNISMSELLVLCSCWRKFVWPIICFKTISSL